MLGDREKFRLSQTQCSQKAKHISVLAQREEANVIWDLSLVGNSSVWQGYTFIFFLKSILCFIDFKLITLKIILKFKCYKLS